MKVYKVGGAVRDALLGARAKDNDYVVVGATAQKMRDLGFVEVGKSFPVFLHPETKEEYALARKEVKTGLKHTDFSFDFSPDITLREDLERRDLTCNGVAYDEKTGEYIDFFGGIQDIKKRILRHINAEHFVEDPLRVLRVCRFSAQLDFEVADETFALCKKMVEDGAMKNLTVERIWDEVVKALCSEHSERFFMLMHDLSALKEIMPEVEALFDVPEKLKYHPEGTTFGHVMSALKLSKGESALVKFGVLTHDLGKALTNKKEWPSHHGHDVLAEKPIKTLCKRLKIPNRFLRFALASARLHMLYFCIFEMRTLKIYELISKLVINHTSYLEEYIKVCRADFESSNCEDRAAGRAGFELKAELLRFALKELEKIKAQDLPDFKKMPKDERFASALKAYKVLVLDQKIREFKNKKGLSF